MKEKGLVPKRRFGEFSTNEWQKYKFDELISRTSISSNEKHLPRVEYDDIISTRGVLNKDFSRKTSNKKGIEFLHGDILFGKLRPYLMNWLLADFNGIAVGDWWVFRSKSANTKFVYALIQNKRFQQIANLSTGTKMPRSDWSTVSQQTYYVPSSQLEQRQIGVFFEKIDRLIELYEQKLSKLKNLKQSYLHKMFPQKGSDVPDMRFEGFSDKWIDKRLDSLFNKGGSGGTPSTNVNEYYEGNIPFLGISDITSSNGYIYSTEKHISAKGMNSSAAWLVPKESISLAMYASVGKVGILKVDSATSQAFYNMVFDDLIVRDFVFHTLDKMEKDGLWRTLISTGTQANLNAEKVKSLEIKIPDSNGEMKKISELLNSINLQINAQERKLDKLRQMKKAYLEEMFV